MYTDRKTITNWIAPQRHEEKENRMKITVERKCGHEEQIEVFGKQDQRERKIYACEHSICTECKLAEETKNCEEIEMKYSEYKENYASCKTGEYNKKTKTIIVYVPKKEETVEENTIIVADIQKDFKENKASESAKKVMHALADSKQIKKEDYPKLKPTLMGIDGSLKVKNEQELADMVIQIVNEGK